MLILKEDSQTAKTIREVEQILREKGVSITPRYDGLIISVTKEDGTSLDFVIRDDEGGEIQDVFPTEFEPTKIQYLEHFIAGK